MFAAKIRDWFDYKDVEQPSKLVDLPEHRTCLGNEIISQGRVVITDRLHASLMSLFIGRPHVMLNDKYKKVQNTREAAFMDKPECSNENLNGYYANTIEEAVEKALWLLKKDF